MCKNVCVWTMKKKTYVIKRGQEATSLNALCKNTCVRAMNIKTHVFKQGEGSTFLMLCVRKRVYWH